MGYRGRGAEKGSFFECHTLSPVSRLLHPRSAGLTVTGTRDSCKVSAASSTLASSIGLEEARVQRSEVRGLLLTSDLRPLTSDHGLMVKRTIILRF